jgi:hypothetical protein
MHEQLVENSQRGRKAPHFAGPLPSVGRQRFGTQNEVRPPIRDDIDRLGPAIVTDEAAGQHASNPTILIAGLSDPVEKIVADAGQELLDATSLAPKVALKDNDGTVLCDRSGQARENLPLEALHITFDHADPLRTITQAAFLCGEKGISRYDAQHQGFGRFTGRAGLKSACPEISAIRLGKTKQLIAFAEPNGMDPDIVSASHLAVDVGQPGQGWIWFEPDNPLEHS